MKKIIYVFAIIILSSSVKVQAQLPPLPDIPRLLDSLALVQFYNTTGGPGWTNNTNWKTATPISSWFGISMIGNRVSAIVLPNNNLTGAGSPAVTVLNALRTINLSGNSLSGGTNLAALLAGKAQLSVVNLSDNNFSGAAPFTLSALPSLIYLDLSNNGFTGALPALTQSSDIQEIYLTGNSFTGSIPASYGGFSSLITLFADSNQLSSGIENLGTSTSLRSINLSANQFTGPIPTALSNILPLQTLWLNNNGFSGPIPSELGSLSLLQILGLNHNALTGTIPSSLSGLNFLTRLNLRENMIEGPLPSFLASLPNLDFLGLISNNFTFAGLESLVGQIATLEYQKQKPVVLMYNPNSGKLSVAAGGTPANNTYTWYMDGSMVATKSGDSTYMPTASGNYYVEVTNSIATELTLRSKNKAVTVNSPISASIYPNPARNITTLSFNLEGNSLVKVSDRNGRVMTTKSISNAKGTSQLKLDVTSYPTGVYFVSISNGKQIQTVQLNKQ